MKKTNIFIDMDGTLARFYEQDDCLKRMYEKGFFENLRPYKKALKMAQQIKVFAEANQIEIYIITSCVESEYCREEKMKWLDKYLPWIDSEHRLFGGAQINKAYFAIEAKATSEINLLIDDYSKNLEEWEAQFGRGTGIKVINEINNKNKKNFVKYLKII